MKEMMLALIVAGILAIVGVLIFSNVSNNATGIFTHDQDLQSESATISAETSAGDNSTLLAQDGYITNSETVINASNSVALNRNVDYVITISGGDGVNDLSTIANFTLINHTGANSFNNSALTVTYLTNEQSSAELTKTNLDTTVLDSFELGVIALIVVAAVAILASLFMLGGRS